MLILVEFDGGCVADRYPDMGKDIGAAPVLECLETNGYHVAIYTGRTNERLREAREWFIKHNLSLMFENPSAAYTDMIISPKGISTPVTQGYDMVDKPYVDWVRVSGILYDKGMLTKEQYDTVQPLIHKEMFD